MALKWAVTDRFHEYLCGGSFQVYIDNNPLMYILLPAKLDAIGQRWVASLAPYNFGLHYKPGWQNVVADSLLRIPWENVTFQDSMDFNVVKAVVDKGETNTVACIEPDLLEPKLTVQMQQMVNTLAGSLTKSQWKIEQESDLEIGLVVSLIKKNEHLQYKVKKEDNAGSKVILRFHDNLCLIDGLLYRKWVYVMQQRQEEYLLLQQQTIQHLPCGGGGLR